MSNIPDDFENGLDEDCDAYLEGAWEYMREKLGEQALTEPESIEKSPVVESVEAGIKEAPLLGCLVAFAGILAGMDWLKKNIGL